MQLVLTLLILATPTPIKEKNDSPNLKKRFFGYYGKGIPIGWNLGNWKGWDLVNW